MKWLGPIAAFVICAGSMWMNLSRRAIHEDFDAVHAEFAGDSAAGQSWDEKNRRPAKSVFFVDVSDWTGASEPEASSRNPGPPTPAPPQSNPFAQ